MHHLPSRAGTFGFHFFFLTFWEGYVCVLFKDFGREFQFAFLFLIEDVFDMLKSSQIQNTLPQFPFGIIKGWELPFWCIGLGTKGILHKNQVFQLSAILGLCMLVYVVMQQTNWENRWGRLVELGMPPSFLGTPAGLQQFDSLEIKHGWFLPPPCLRAFHFVYVFRRSCNETFIFYYIMWSKQYSVKHCDAVLFWGGDQCWVVSPPPPTDCL